MFLSAPWSHATSQYHLSESGVSGSYSVCLWVRVTWFQPSAPAAVCAVCPTHSATADMQESSRHALLMVVCYRQKRRKTNAVDVEWFDFLNSRRLCVCVCVSLLGNIIHCILTLLSCNHQQVFTWETTTTSFFVFHPLSQLHHRVTRKTEQSRWINWWLWKQFFFLKYFYINIKLAFPPSPSTHNLKGDSVGHRWEDVAESNPDHQAPVSSLFQRPLLPRTELTRQWLLNYVKSGFTVWLKKTLHFHT